MPVAVVLDASAKMKETAAAPFPNREPQPSRLGRRYPQRGPRTVQRHCSCHRLRLLFVQIFTRHIILRHLVRVNFLFIGALGVFHADHRGSLERISFLEQLVDALRVRSFKAG